MEVHPEVQQIHIIRVLLKVFTLPADPIVYITTSPSNGHDEGVILPSSRTLNVFKYLAIRQDR